MTWTIGPVREDDAEELGPLHDRLWREAYRGLLPEHVFDRRAEGALEAWRERGRQHERYGRSAEGAVTHVARLDGRPIGWVSVGPARDADPPTAVELWSLYLATEHQGSGVAADLVRSLLPSGPAYLWVLDGNERAMSFYRRHGFALDGALKDDERWDCRELRMVR